MQVASGVTSPSQRIKYNVKRLWKIVENAPLCTVQARRHWNIVDQVKTKAKICVEYLINGSGKVRLTYVLRTYGTISEVEEEEV